LVGEAYFDARGVNDVPFTIRTGSVATRVLGTTFAVRHYATDGAVQVAVMSGKVAVVARTHAHLALTLTAGNVGRITDSTALVISTDSARRYTAWTTGQLVFRGVPMPEVLTTLTRWYGYRFRLADSALANHIITAVLDAQSPANALGTIKLLLNVDLTFEGDVVTLHSKQTQAMPAIDRHDTHKTLTTPHAEVGR